MKYTFKLVNYLILYIIIRRVYYFEQNISYTRNPLRPLKVVLVLI